MRKSLALLLAALLLLAGSLTAFAADETITVLIGIDAAGKHMGERAQEFEAKTGITVNLVEVEWDTMVNKQAVALKAKEPTYDIVDCGSFMLPEYVPGGLYADISDMYTPADRAKFMDGMIEAVTLGGKLYAAPLMASWTIMFYNSEMFKNAGLNPNKPPKTWDEMVAYGKKLQGPTIYAIADSLAQGEQASCAFFRWAKSAGAKISEFRGNKVYWLLDSPECVQALQFMQKMMKDGIMDPGSPTYFQQQISDLFGKGQAAMLVNWDMMQLAFKNPEQTPYAGKIFPAVMPGAKAGLSGSIEGHEYLAIPSPSQHKAAAKQFIKFLQSPEVQKKRALEDGQTPVLKALFKDPDIKKVINLDVVFQSAAGCYYRPAVPEYTQCSDVISAELQNALVSNKDVKKALQDANAKCNKLSGW